MIDGAVVVASAASALAVGLAGRIAVPPPRRLRTRIIQYLSPSVSSLLEPGSPGAFGAVFGPMARDLADWVGRRLDRVGASASVLKLRQAGWFAGEDEDSMISSYRMLQLKTLVAAASIATLAGHAMSASMPVRALLLALGFVFGIGRVRGRLDRAIEVRREAMKIEIYTVNQLMAMRVRAGGGVVHAVNAIVSRGDGEVVAELREALRLHRSGWRSADALRRIAELTPEPFCARTYRLLASADERGADLASALLALSEDVRETRRESIKRTATRRRAAMLVPTIAILAPVLLLFVAAPLPYLITSWQ